MNDPVQTTAVLKTTSSVSPWVFWGSVFAPIILSAVFTSVLVVAWRRVNRADGNPPLKPSKIFIITMTLGAFMGAVSQWGMQEIVAAMTGIAAQYKMIIVAAIFTGPLSMLLYNGLRWQAKSRGWTGLYNFISVKHDPAIDYETEDVSDFTVMSDEDKTEER